jgi:hypothetical protein
MGIGKVAGIKLDPVSGEMKSVFSVSTSPTPARDTWDGESITSRTGRGRQI